MYSHQMDIFYLSYWSCWVHNDCLLSLLIPLVFMKRSISVQTYLSPESNVYSQLRVIRKLNARQRPFSSVAYWYSYLCCCNKRGIRACDPRQFSFQLDSYQQGSYQDPPSNPAVRSWISLKSISWSSIMLTGSDLRVCHCLSRCHNHLERKHGLQQ